MAMTNLMTPRWAVSVILVGALVLWGAGCSGGTGDEPPPSGETPAADDHADDGADEQGDDHGHDDGDHDHDHGHDGDHGHGHAHTHTAPHGGALHPVGDHLAHVELTFDPGTGEITLYTLGGHAAEPVPVAAETIVIAFDEPAGAARVTLTAARSPLADEGEGQSSKFTGTAAPLVGAAAFSGRIVSNLTLRGADLNGFRLRFPDGTEGESAPPDDHDHADDHDH
jgi:hypothetical protein